MDVGTAPASAFRPRSWSRPSIRLSTSACPNPNRCAGPGTAHICFTGANRCPRWSSAARFREVVSRLPGQQLNRSDYYMTPPNRTLSTPITIRQVKYLNNVVEQDHRAIKRITRTMLGFKNFQCARVILSGVELMHMIKNGQMKCQGETPLSPAQQFYSLVS